MHTSHCKQQLNARIHMNNLRFCQNEEHKHTEELGDCCAHHRVASIAFNKKMAFLKENDPTIRAEMRCKVIVEPSSTNSDEDDDYEALKRLRKALEQMKFSSVCEKSADMVNVGEIEQETSCSSETDDCDFLEEEDELINIQETRRKQLEAYANIMQNMKQFGFLQCKNVSVVDVLRLKERIQRVVCHVYNPSSLLSARIDLHLEQLSQKYAGTMFVRTRLSLYSSFADQYGINQYGAMLCFQGGHLKSKIQNLTEFGNEEVLAIDKLEHWLEHTGVLSQTLSEEEKVIFFTGTPQSSAHTNKGSDSEDNTDMFYDCGLPNCKRTFAHHHINHIVFQNSTNTNGIHGDTDQNYVQALPSDFLAK